MPTRKNPNPVMFAVLKGNRVLYTGTEPADLPSLREIAAKVKGFVFGEPVKPKSYAVRALEERLDRERVADVRRNPANSGDWAAMAVDENGNDYVEATYPTEKEAWAHITRREQESDRSTARGGPKLYLGGYATECSDVRANGVYDPGVLKAVFLAGGPGSGKSYQVQQIFGVPGDMGITTASACGLKLVINDPYFERILHSQGISPKSIAGMTSAEVEQITGWHPLPDGTKTPFRQSLDIRDKFLAQYLDGRLGLIMDGTGANLQKIAGQKAKLEALGYDCAMIFVNTTLAVAHERNMQRERSLQRDVVDSMWHEVQNNMGAFQDLFGANLFLVDASAYGPTSPGIVKRINAFLRTPIQNYIGRQWLAAELAAKDRTGSPRQNPPQYDYGSPELLALETKAHAAWNDATQADYDAHAWLSAQPGGWTDGRNPTGIALYARAKQLRLAAHNAERAWRAADRGWSDNPKVQSNPTECAITATRPEMVKVHTHGKRAHYRTADVEPFWQSERTATAVQFAKKIGWPASSVRQIIVSNFGWMRCVLTAHGDQWLTRDGAKTLADGPVQSNPPKLTPRAEIGPVQLWTDAAGQLWRSGKAAPKKPNGQPEKASIVCGPRPDNHEAVLADFARQFEPRQAPSKELDTSDPAAVQRFVEATGAVQAPQSAIERWLPNLAYNLTISPDSSDPTKSNHVKMMGWLRIADSLRTLSVQAGGFGPNNVRTEYPKLVAEMFDEFDVNEPWLSRVKEFQDHLERGVYTAKCCGEQRWRTPPNSEPTVFLPAVEVPEPAPVVREMSPYWQKMHQWAAQLHELTKQEQQQRADYHKKFRTYPAQQLPAQLEKDKLARLVSDTHPQAWQAVCDLAQKIVDSPQVAPPEPAYVAPAAVEVPKPRSKELDEIFAQGRVDISGLEGYTYFTELEQHIRERAPNLTDEQVFDRIDNIADQMDAQWRHFGKNMAARQLHGAVDSARKKAGIKVPTGWGKIHAARRREAAFREEERQAKNAADYAKGQAEHARLAAVAAQLDFPPEMIENDNGLLVVRYGNNGHYVYTSPDNRNHWSIVTGSGDRGQDYIVFVKSENKWVGGRKTQGLISPEFWAVVSKYRYSSGSMETITAADTEEIDGGFETALEALEATDLDSVPPDHRAEAEAAERHDAAERAAVYVQKRDAQREKDRKESAVREQAAQESAALMGETRLRQYDGKRMTFELGAFVAGMRGYECAQSENGAKIIVKSPKGTEVGRIEWRGPDKGWRAGCGAKATYQPGAREAVIDVGQCLLDRQANVRRNPSWGGEVSANPWPQDHIGGTAGRVVGIPKGEFVRVHFNLNEGGYTVETRETGDWRRKSVVDSILLQHAYFTVQPAGRQKTIQESRRNVHAWIFGVPKSGEFHGDAATLQAQGWRQATYIPAENVPAAFVDRANKTPLPDGVDVLLQSQLNTSGRKIGHFAPEKLPIMWWRLVGP